VGEPLLAQNPATLPWKSGFTVFGHTPPDDRQTAHVTFASRAGYRAHVFLFCNKVLLHIVILTGRGGPSRRSLQMVRIAISRPRRDYR
jgi:hypothetical protein